MSAEPSPYKVDARLVFKAVIGLVVLLGVSYLCGVVLREPIEVGGKAALDRLGYWGLAGGVIITDASPLPMTNEPLVILAIGAGRPANTVFAVISAASVCAGFVGWTAGRYLGDVTGIGPWMRRRYPGFERFMLRYGAYGVAVCALLPIPFALSTWSAGMMRTELWKVALASLVRIPKTAFYVWLIMVGWSASGG
jgi:membrane protein YqaA with SNARE-associated domain